VDDGVPAVLVAAGGPPAALVDDEAAVRSVAPDGAADEQSAGGAPDVASRASRPDHPNPRRALSQSHSDTSRDRAILCCTNSSGGHPT